MINFTPSFRDRVPTTWQTQERSRFFFRAELWLSTIGRRRNLCPALWQRPLSGNPALRHARSRCAPALAMLWPTLHLKWAAGRKSCRSVGACGSVGIGWRLVKYMPPDSTRYAHKIGCILIPLILKSVEGGSLFATTTSLGMTRSGSNQTRKTRDAKGSASRH